MLLRILEARHLEIVGQLKVCFRISFKRFEVYNERVLDGEDCVVINVLALPVKDLSDDRLVAGGGELRGVST